MTTAVLHLYPAEFRDEYGRELRIVFRDRLRSHPGALSVLWTLLHALAGVLFEAPKEHSQMLLHDLKYAARVLRKEPLVTVAATTILALGIGATTLVFSFANALVVRPLPYPDQGRLIAVQERSENAPQFTTVSFPNFHDMRRRTTMLEDMAAYGESTRALRDDNGAPEQIPFGFVSASIFRVLGVEPALGRVFTDKEDVPKGPPVVVLGYDLWQRRYGGNPAVLGRTVQTGSVKATVIGVMPAGFHFPERAEVWAPLQMDPLTSARTDYFLLVVGRLKPGVTLQQADTEIRAMMKQINAEHPVADGGKIGHAIDFREAISERYRDALLSLMCAVALLLLIACANVSNLLLVKASSRKREMAVRTALGASRRRLVRQLVTESLMLGVLGGICGVAVAAAGIPALLSLIPVELPRWMSFSMDLRVLAFAIGLSVLTSLVFGTAPAFFVSRDVSNGLKESGRGRTASMRQNLLRNGLVVTEVALSLTLLIGAGLMMRSFLALRTQDLGYNPDKVVTMRIASQNNREYLRRLQEELQSAPGVKSVAFASSVPLSSTWGRSLTVEGYPVPALKDAPSIFHTVVTPGYFQTLGIRLLQGRDFNEHDFNTKIVVVSESLARKYWPDGSALGRRIRFGPPQDNEPWHTVIGVVAQATNEEIRGGGRSNVYVPWNGEYDTSALIARGAVDPAQLAQTLRSRIMAIDRTAVLSRVLSMQQVVTRVTWQDRFFAVLFTVFASLALALAAGGLYAVIAYTVSMRTQEIGIRMALGASASQVRSWVMKQGIALTIIGLVVGVCAASAATRLLKSQLYQVSPMDATTYVSVVGVMLLVALAAAYLPARRATRVDPMIALRQE
jgi:putative ABC transport system permease protein